MAATIYRTFLMKDLTSTPVCTPPIDVSNMANISVQMCVESGSSVGGQLQISNVPTSGDSARPSAKRDDAADSVDWGYVGITANMPNTNAGASNVTAISNQAFRALRYRLTSTGTTGSVRIHIFAQGASS